VVSLVLFEITVKNNSCFGYECKMGQLNNWVSFKEKIFK